MVFEVGMEVTLDGAWGLLSAGHMGAFTLWRFTTVPWGACVELSWKVT